MIKRIFFIALFAACSNLQITALAQKPVVIKLDNPSFEDYPQAGHQPSGWFDCGFAGETPPDVNPTGQFKVSKNAYHGSTYVGMVTRDNNTWEAVGQRLKTPLLKGVTYTFSIYLARSEIYMSQSRATGRDVNYITPATLRIWGGSGYCSKEEMIAETEPISAATWQKFSFKITPKANHNYFMIEAFYKVPTLFPYNGNVLVDNASDLVPYVKEEPTVKPPTIAIAKPVNKSSVTTSSTELRATVANISDKSQISIIFNGKELSDFDFDKDSHLVKSDLRLSEGSNTINIRVKNKNGEAAASTTVKYEGPTVAAAKPPTIAIIKPINKATVKAPSVELRATVGNITDKSQISITFNGKGLTDFEFDKEGRFLKSNLRLSEGTNTINIQVKNKDGNASASTSINYEVPAVATTPPAEAPNLKEGSIIKIEKLQFAPNSADIDQSSVSSLDAIYNLLEANPNMIVEIGGHTNMVIEEGMSLRLSLNRAKAVADYLIGKGIDKKRLVTKGYGKSSPIVNGEDQAANKINQRVEIKILSTNG